MVVSRPMEYLSKDILKKIPIPEEDSHKGENGKVLIIGGSKDYFGAPILAGLTALRFVDKVGILTVREVHQKIYHPEFILYSCGSEYLSKKDIKQALKISLAYDVVLLGSGLGKNKKTEEFVNGFLGAYKGKIVIDADAIKIINKVTFSDAILTPNQNEVRYLRDKKEEILEKNNVILLKGKEDKIITREKILINNTGNVGLTKAGTGDVLAGLVAALYTKLTSKDAASLGAYLLGIVGDEVYKEKLYFYTPLDLIERIPKVVRKYLSS